MALDTEVMLPEAIQKTHQAFNAFTELQSGGIVPYTIHYTTKLIELGKILNQIEAKYSLLTLARIKQAERLKHALSKTVLLEPAKKRWEEFKLNFNILNALLLCQMSEHYVVEIMTKMKALTLDDESTAESTGESPDESPDESTGANPSIPIQASEPREPSKPEEK